MKPFPPAKKPNRVEDTPVSSAADFRRCVKSFLFPASALQKWWRISDFCSPNNRNLPNPRPQRMVGRSM